jgi:hypothetical protein
MGFFESPKDFCPTQYLEHMEWCTSWYAGPSTRPPPSPFYDYIMYVPCLVL